MKNKKKWFIATAVVVALVCLLPFPRKIQRSYCAVETHTSTASPITIDLTYLDFLFLSDVTFGEIEISYDKQFFRYGGSLLLYDGMVPAGQDGELAHSIRHPRGNYRQGFFAVDHFYADPEFSMLLVQRDGLQFAGHVQEGRLQEAMDFFDFCME